VRNDRGAALPAALALVVVVTSAGYASLSRARTELAAARCEAVHERAVHAADAGVETARAALARDPAWAGGTVRVGTCDVVVAVTRGDGGWFVSSRAQPGDVRARVLLTQVEGRLPAVTGWSRAP
jgi:hypothetical protein